MSLPLRIFFRTVLTMALVWAMARFLPQYFFMTGGWGAVIVIGSLLTLMNLIVRPLLTVVTFPLKLLATLLTLILVNAAFLWMVVWIARHMDPALVTLQIMGGLGGWLVISIIIGAANWLMKEVLR